jgi:hypothetical protein
MPDRKGKTLQEIVMSLTAIRVIEIPASANLFDHGAFEPKSRRVFMAHTGRDRVEVIEHDASRHLATSPTRVTSS